MMGGRMGGRACGSVVGQPPPAPAGSPTSLCPARLPPPRRRHGKADAGSVLGVPADVAAQLRAACQPLVDYLEQESEEESEEEED